MRASEFVDEIFRLWPKAFQPREQWESEVVEAVTEFSVAQLDGGLKALKLKRAGRAIDLEAVVEACRATPPDRALPPAQSPLNFKRPPGAATKPFLEWLKSRDMMEAYGRAPVNEKIMVARLVDVLWGGSQWEAKADEIAGRGHSWERLERLYDKAMQTPECQTTSVHGWFAPWADRSASQA